jgi:hypothetical protein
VAQIDIDNTGSVTTPATGKTTVYVDSADKFLKSKNDAGVVTNYGALGTSITSLTGEVTATGPGAAAATVTNSAVLGKVLTGLSGTSGTISATDTILQAFNKIVGQYSAPWFPTATDGDVVISVDTTLTRDMYYNTLVINSGVTLTTGGYRIFAFTSIENNGTIARNGNDAIGTAGGVALVVGSLAVGVAGGAGGTAAGTAGTGATGLGGSGGAGGLGSGGAGGAGGILTNVSANNGGTEVLQAANRAILVRDLANTAISGGAGGGGGGGDGTAGGGGGGSAGTILVCSRTIFGTGVLKAMGGNGGTPAGGNRGGGGGGGGGVICFISSNDTTLTSLTTNVSGGLGSSGTGTGVTGSNGSVGRVYRVRV